MPDSRRGNIYGLILHSDSLFSQGQEIRRIGGRIITFIVSSNILNKGSGVFIETNIIFKEDVNIIKDVKIVEEADCF